MIGNNRVIAIIPARGGSKSIPKKNLCFLNGKPLLAWTLEAAKKTDIIDRIIVSTDDKEIKREAIRQDCEVYKRPLKLSTDTSLVEDTVRYMYNLLIKEGEKCDIMLLLEVTSPFRTPYLIKKCVERLVTENLDSLATFNKADLNPQRAWKIIDGLPKPYFQKSNPWNPRQLLDEAYQLNGLVYVFRPNKFSKSKCGFLFGKIGAEIVENENIVDIDSEKDFLIADALMREKS